MKTRLFFVIAFAFFVQITNAQMLGIKGGVNFANMSFSTSGMDISPKSIVGLHLGLVFDFKMQENLNFNAGFLYSLKGCKFKGSLIDGASSANDGTLTFNYFEIPLNFAYKFPINDKSKFFIQAGPYLAYAMSGKDKTGSETQDIKFGNNQWKRFDYGLGFGAGLEFGAIVTSLNYELGLANLSDDSSADMKIKNKVFQISIAYMFGNKK